MDSEYYRIKQKLKKNTSSQAIRYRGLNLHSWFYQGTLEFRHHEGSTDWEEIVNWAMFCGFIVDLAKAGEWHWLEKLVAGTIDTPARFERFILSEIPDNFPNRTRVFEWIKGRVTAMKKEVFDPDITIRRPARRGPTATGRTGRLEEFVIRPAGGDYTVTFDDATAITENNEEDEDE
jgi:hypothetical protein